MKNTFSCIAICGIMAAPIFAGTYTWGNLTVNGSLNGASGHALAGSTNWVGNSTPSFDNQAHLIFTGLGVSGSTSINAGATTTTLNRLTVSTASQLRLNSSSSTLSFQGTAPTIDVQSGTLRLDVKLSSGAAGITKTGAGTIFSNLQSVSAGFTGPFTISQGTVTSGNNYALGEQKTVNIGSGGALNMNGQRWGASAIVDGTTVSRNYTFNIAGTGTAGEGAITNGNNTAVDVLSGLSGIYNLNLDANAAVGGSGDYAIGAGGSIKGNGYTLTKTGTNQIYISGGASNIAYQVDQGTLVGYQSDAAFGGQAGSVSVAGSATLASDGNRSFANSLTFADGAILNNKSGSGSWTGNVTLSGGSAIITGASSSAAITMSGVLSGNGGITKTGANTLNLTKANLYTGKTLINQGSLAISGSGSIAKSSEISLSSGATLDVSQATGFEIKAGQKLSGGGTILGNVTISGESSPGFSPGLQTFSNNLTYTTGSSVVWELVDQTLAGRGTNYDGVNVTGNLAFTGATTVMLDFSLLESNVDWSSSFWNNSYLGSNGWKIFSVGGQISGFENITLDSSMLDGSDVSLASQRSGASFSIFQGQDGIYLNYTAVPEPGAALLGGVGMLLMLRRRRS